MTDLDQLERAVTIRRGITSCTRCPLHQEASSPVPWSGPLNPEVAVLGEAPGRTEDLEQKPFIGPAGRLLRALLSNYGIPPKDVTFLNSANCWPRTTGTPTKEHLTSCKVHLVSQLSVITPRHLLVVGTTALSAVVGDHIQMKDVRARPLWLERLEPWQPFSRPIVCWPLYHPAAALRSSAYRLKIEEDLEKFVQWRKEGGLFPSDCVKCGEEVEVWDQYGLAWCEGHAAKQLEML